MSEPQPNTPSGVGAGLRAVPRLSFEIRRTVATMSSGGFAPGYSSTEVTLLSDAALELQRALGPEQFAALLILAMSATEELGRLVVDGATALVGAQTGWSRPKSSRALASLEVSGFIHRAQSHEVMDTGRLKFGRTRTWLSPELYQTVERRLTVATTDRITASPPSAVTKRDSTQKRSVVSIRDSTMSAVTKRDSTNEDAGLSGGTSRDTAVVGQHHGDVDDYELHPSATYEVKPALPPVPPTDPDLAAMRIPSLVLSDEPGQPTAQTQISRLVGLAAPVTVDEVRELTPTQLADVLTSWQVFAAADLVASTPRPVLTAAMATITTRWASIDNPGAYLRRLLREAGRGSTSTPAVPKAALRRPPLPQAPAASWTAAPTADTATEAEIAAALSLVAPDERARMEEAATAAIEASPWARGSLISGLRQITLASELRRCGALPPQADEPSSKANTG